VLDERLQLSPALQLARTARETPLLVFASATADEWAAAALESHGVEVVREPGGGRDLRAVLKHLHRLSLQSVLVEGGATVAGMFLDAALVDKVSFFIAPLIIGGREAKAAVGGTGATRIIDALRLEEVEITHHGSDVEITGYPQNRGHRSEVKG